MKKFLVALLTLVCAASLVGNYLLFQRYSSQRPLMAIGSKTITIREYQDALDSRYGKEVLNEMAFRELIRQAATGAKVAATETEVRNRIAAIERRDPKAVEAARNSPERMKELEAQVAAN
ncbi:MAG: hypothetical protein SFU56_08310, partial [Capsulimonadales bacterium]|nr:hypothetical protein [Capsulimonadales bacterium]